MNDAPGVFFFCASDYPITGNWFDGWLFLQFSRNVIRLNILVFFGERAIIRLNELMLREGIRINGTGQCVALREHLSE